VRWLVVKKNCNSASRPSERLEQLQVDWKHEYECLRQEALHLDTRRGHGLALFQSRGMMAWLQALAALKPRGVTQNVIEQSASLPSISRSDLRALLASMVLSCMERKAHEHSI
jgi:hypothetical protein